VAPAYLGVGVYDNSRQLAQQYGISVTTGALVEQVQSGSPADQAGLQAYDVITSFGGQTVTNSTGLVKLISEHKAGDRVPMTVVRGSQTLHLTAVLAQKPASQS
jgi:S1-C subfamily serine protease